MAYQSEIEKLEQRYHENPQQWFAALADSYRKGGDLDLALEVVRGGLEKRPNYASGHIVLGRCLLDKQLPDEAALSFEQVLELDAENIIALKSLGDIAEQKGYFTEAKQWLNRLLDIDPMNEEARESVERIGDAETPPPEEEEVIPESAEAAGEEAAPVAPAIEPGAAWAAEAMAGMDRGETTPAEPSQAASDVAAESAKAEPEPAVDEPLAAEQPPVVAETQPVADGEFAIERTSWDDSQGAAALEAPAEDTAGQLGADVGADSEAAPVTVEPIQGLEATAAEPAASQEPVVAPEPVETVESTEPPEGGQVRIAGDLEVVSFDEELSWDAGEHQSAAITNDDIVDADAHHEDVAPAVEFLGDPEAVAAREGDEGDGGGEVAEAVEEAGDVLAESVETEVPGGPATPEPPAAPVVLEKPAEVLGLADFPEPAPTAPEQVESAAAQEPAAGADEPVVAASGVSAEVLEAAEPVAGFAGGAIEAEEPAVPEEPAVEPAEPVMAAGSDAAVPDELPVADAETVEPAEAVGSQLEESAEFDQGVDLPLIMPEEVTPPAEEPGEMEPVVTETMAEVYARQGLYEQAKETYEKLLQQRPGDAALEQRLAEVAEQVGSEVVAETTSRFSIAATGGESAVAYLQSVFQVGTAVSAAPDLYPDTASADAQTPADETAVPQVSDEAIPSAEPIPLVEAAVADETAAADLSTEFTTAAGSDVAAATDLSAEAAGSEPAPESEQASVLESAFGGEPDEPPGSPTIPASDEVSLSSVFGSEPPQPAGEAEPNGGASGGSGPVSFDEFYGAAAEAPQESESAEKVEEKEEEDDEGSDDDFRNWLEGLKT